MYVSVCVCTCVCLGTHTHTHQKRSSPIPFLPSSTALSHGRWRKVIYGPSPDHTTQQNRWTKSERERECVRECACVRVIICLSVASSCNFISRTREDGEIVPGITSSEKGWEKCQTMMVQRSVVKFYIITDD